MTLDSMGIPPGHLARTLDQGRIGAWLLAGPFAPGTRIAPSFDVHRPAEGAVIDPAQDVGRGAAPDRWAVVTCETDLLAHLDRAGGVGAYGLEGAFAWLCGILQTDEACVGELVVTHSQEVALWVNGIRCAPLTRDEPAVSPAQTMLGAPVDTRYAVEWQAGRNEIRIHTRFGPGDDTSTGRWLVGARLGRAQGRSAEPSWLLPTALTPLARRENLTEMFAEAYLEQDIFQAKERIWVRWPPTTQRMDNLTVRLQAPNRRIYAEGYIEAMAGTTIPVAGAEALPDGRYDVVLMPRPEEYYEQEVRVLRRIPIGVVANQPSATYYGDYAGRVQEALEDAAGRKGLFAQLACIALGKPERVEPSSFDEALAAVGSRSPAWRWRLLGLVGLSLRGGAEPVFWEQYRSDVHAFAQAIPLAAARQDEAIAAATIAALVGRSDGLAQARGWLHACGRRGFALWNSPIACERMVAALSHLLELVPDEEVAEMAAVVLDKLLFGLGANSFQGVLGGAQRETSASILLGSGTAPTAGVARLAWGKGTYNAHLLGTVSLALARSYEPPEIIAATAVDAVTPVTLTERHAELSHMAGDVHKLVYRTRHGMLSAALDYRPGEPGNGEHIWQATLGPGAVIFVNHPALGADALDAGDRLFTGNGFWLGNGRLPRVAQAGNLLAAWYRVPEDDRMGYTHAYFPRALFDEHSLVDKWAFARKGDGYVALYAANGLTSVESGPGAWRELRTPGREAFWLCRLGNAEEDGTFQQFREAAVRAHIAVDGGVVRAGNLWGKALEFGWTGEFRVGASGPDGTPPNLTAHPLRFADHYKSEFCHAPFPADSIEINYKGYAMRLEFGEGGDGRADCNG